VCLEGSEQSHALSIRYVAVALLVRKGGTPNKLDAWDSRMPRHNSIHTSITGRATSNEIALPVNAYESFEVAS